MSTRRQGRPDSDLPEDWFHIKRIVAEKKNRGKLEYRVEWEGLDPETNKPYPFQWVVANEVSDVAIWEWNEGKDRPQLQTSVGRQGLKRRRGSRPLDSPVTPDVSSPPSVTREQKRSRLVRAGSLESSRPSTAGLSSAVTDSPGSDRPPSSWEVADEVRNDQDRLEVLIRQPDALDWADYQSVALSSSQPNTQVSASQISIYSLPPDPAVSKRHWPSVIPDSQEESSGESSYRPVTTIVSPEDHGSGLESSSGVPSHQTDPLRVVLDSQTQPFSRSATAPLQSSEPSGSRSLPGLFSSQSVNGHSSPRVASTRVHLTKPRFTPAVASSALPAPNRRTLASQSRRSGQRPSLLSPASRPPTSSERIRETPRLSAPIFTPPGQLPGQLPARVGSLRDSRGNSPRYFTQPQFSSIPELLTSLASAGDARNAAPANSIVPGTGLRLPIAVSQRASASPVLRFESILRTPNRGSQRTSQSQPPESPHGQLDSAGMAETQKASGESATDLLLSLTKQLHSFDEAAENEHLPEYDAPAPMSSVDMEHDVEASALTTLDQSNLVLGSIPEPSLGGVASQSPSIFPLSAVVVGTQNELGGFSTTIPATVAPAEVSSSLHVLETIQPPLSEMPASSLELSYASGRRLPHLSEEMADIAATQDAGHAAESGGIMTADIPDISEDEDEESPDVLPFHTVIDPLSKEYLVTLPFASNRRQQYLEILREAEDAIDEFQKAFCNEVLRTPKKSSVFKIDRLFSDLVDICDLPDRLGPESLKEMSDKERQKLCVETNAKFAFVFDLLANLKDTDSKVLIIARSDEILYFLESLVVPEGYAYSRNGLRFAQGTSESGMKVVLLNSNEKSADSATDFDIVVGFDFEFRHSAIAKAIASVDTPSLPYVFSLVIGHSIEHLDVKFASANPGIEELEHKNGLNITLWRMRGEVLHPSDMYWKPYHIATELASMVKQEGEPLTWRPMEVPDLALNVYMDSSQPTRLMASEEETVASGGNAKKRKMGGDDGVVAKRRKIGSGQNPFVDVASTRALEPFVKMLGEDVLDGQDGEDLDFTKEVTVPAALLRAVEYKLESLQQITDESKGLSRDLKKQISTMEASYAEYTKQMPGFVSRLREATDERGRFELERNNAISESEKLQKALALSNGEVEVLKAKFAELQAAAKARSAVEAGRATTIQAQPEGSGAAKAGAATATSPDGTNDQELEEARAEVTRLRKKVDAAEGNLEYTRKAYQDASQAASDLGLENAELRSGADELRRAADESVRRVHETTNQARASELESLVDERDHMLRDRDAMLERLHRELASARNGRRETRQASVPRSPRLGNMMMSPRPGTAAAAAGFALAGIGLGATASGAGGGRGSRGTSPAPALDPGLPTAMTYNGSRWGHLRD